MSAVVRKLLPRMLNQSDKILCEIQNSKIHQTLPGNLEARPPSFLHILLFMAAHSATACTARGERAGANLEDDAAAEERRGEERRGGGGINAKEPRRVSVNPGLPQPQLAPSLARYRCHLNQHIAQASCSPSPWHSFGTVRIG